MKFRAAKAWQLAIVDIARARAHSKLRKKSLLGLRLRRHRIVYEEEARPKKGADAEGV